MPEITKDDLKNRFTYHKPIGLQAEKYVTIRQIALDFAEAIVEITPSSREQSVALTKLEEVVFWANAAVARNTTLTQVDV